jgi:hypothetical protein
MDQSGLNSMQWSQIPRMEFNPSRDQITDPVLLFYFDYWHQKRCGRARPTRADIKARELSPHLGSLILLEALPGCCDFRYRLIGTRVTEYFLGDATGKTMREAYANAQLPQLFIEAAVAMHRVICESAYIARVKAGHGDLLGRFYPDFDALYFPLSSDGARCDMVMTAFRFNFEKLRGATLSADAVL